MTSQLQVCFKVREKRITLMNTCVVGEQYGQHNLPCEGHHQHYIHLHGYMVTWLHYIHLQAHYICTCMVWQGLVIRDHGNDDSM